MRRGVTPDVLTDQTSAHDALNGYVPNGLTLARPRRCAHAIPTNTSRARWRRWPTRPRDAGAAARGAITFDYGNNIRAQAAKAGVDDAFDIPGFVPEYIRPLFCEGKGPFRWAALSGDPADIAATDDLALEMFADDEALCRWIRLAARARRVPGAAGAHLLARARRARALRPGDQRSRPARRVTAPIVIGRDHLDTGSVASPNRETEGMRDGSDAIADWPVLNALLNTASGATWVSVHHGGGVGIGYSLHAGMVVVADGTREADEKLERVLTCDPGIGVARHADAGYTRTLDRGRRRRTCHRTPVPTREEGTHDDSERPALERACSPRSTPDAGLAHSRASAAAAPAARRCCCGCAIRSGGPASTSTSNASRPRPSGSSTRSGDVAVRGASTAAAGDRGDARAAFDARSAFLDAARAPGRAGDVPARRVPRAPDVRELPGPAPRAARPDRRRSRPSGNRFVLTRRTPRARCGCCAIARPRFESHPRAAAHAAEILTSSGHGDTERPHWPAPTRYVARAVHALTDGPRPAARPRDADELPAAMGERRRRPDQRAGRADAPGGRADARCRFCYELRLHRARGYGALKAILEILAEEEEPLTLTEIAHRLQRTPGSTKDYLSWLEDVDLVTSRQKRYSFADPLLRLWVRLHCRPAPPTDDEIAREVHRYALPRLPMLPPRRARRGAAGGRSTRARPATMDDALGGSSRSTSGAGLAPKLRGTCSFPSASAPSRASCSASFFARPVASASDRRHDDLDVERLR